MDLVEMLFNNAMNAEGGGGGGGVTFPTFTLSLNSWSCDMTYTEAKANYMASVDVDDFAPALFVKNSLDDGNTQMRKWGVDELAMGERLSGFVDVPETVTEGLAILFLSEGLVPIALYAEDGNFYEPKN